MNFKDKKITVMGLGLHGGNEGLIRYLVSQGAHVKVSDMKTKEDLMPTVDRLSDLDISYRLGGHSWDHFADADMIFINQAVKPNSLWRKRIERSGIPTSTETNLFFENCPAPIIGITGTNGKSTAATLVYEILKKGYEESERNVFFGGNIGGSLLTDLDKITEKDLVVMELSSFQLKDLEMVKKSPHISIILNITPDHFDYHKDFASYVAAKKNIFKFQEATDFLILNFDQKIVRRLSNEAESRSIFFSCEKRLKNGAYIKDNFIFACLHGGCKKIIRRKKIRLKGEHNLQNVLSAIACANIYKVDRKKIRAAISEFKALPHRIEFVSEISGAKYYNDSKATTPESTIAALSSFSAPIILLCGGSEKYSKFGRMSREIIKKCKAMMVFGQTKIRIKGSIEKNFQLVEKPRLKRENVFICEDMKEAFEKAKLIAKSGDIVLLSPACASFDQFANFEERGDKFKKMVKGQGDAKI